MINVTTHTVIRCRRPGLGKSRTSGRRVPPRGGHGSACPSRRARLSVRLDTAGWGAGARQPGLRAAQGLGTRVPAAPPRRPGEAVPGRKEAREAGGRGCASGVGQPGGSPAGCQDAAAAERSFRTPRHRPGTAALALPPSPSRHGEPRQAWRTARGTGTDRALGSLRLQRRRARGAGARRQRGQVRFPRRDPAPRVGGAPAAGVPCTPLQLQRRGEVPWDKRMAAAPFPDQPSVWRSPPRGTLGRGCWKPLGYFLFGFVGKS